MAPADEHLQNGSDKIQIPIIDIRDSSDQTADELVEAIANSGFVFIRGAGTGFDAEVISNIFEIVLPPMLFAFISRSYRADIASSPNGSSILQRKKKNNAPWERMYCLPLLARITYMHEARLPNSPHSEQRLVRHAQRNTRSRAPGGRSSLSNRFPHKSLLKILQYSKEISKSTQAPLLSAPKPSPHT